MVFLDRFDFNLDQFVNCSNDHKANFVGAREEHCRSKADKSQYVHCAVTVQCHNETINNC